MTDGIDHAGSFRAARDLLLELRDDQPAARERFRWPRPEHFNYARDWFDAVAAGRAAEPRGTVDARGGRLDRTPAHLRRARRARSRRLAGWLAGAGRAPRRPGAAHARATRSSCGRRCSPASGSGAVVIPATTLLSRRPTSRDRIERGRVRHVVARAADATVRGRTRGRGRGSPSARPSRGGCTTADAEGCRPGRGRQVEDTGGDETLLLYFTSGTTAPPKLVEHTHTSYPIGHLTTMYWIGLQPGDVHLNISSPGLGEARVEQPVRAVERRGDRTGRQPAAVRRRGPARDDGTLRRHDLLRAADRVADARADRPGGVARAASRCARWSGPASRSTPR